MSLIQDLGAQLRAVADELPTGPVTVALQRLRSASELLMWVREASIEPIGVPQLGNAVEHAERASAALRLAQDSIADYLFLAGLTADASRPPDQDWRATLSRGDQAPQDPGAPTVPTDDLGAWWQQRVTQLTGEPPPTGEKSDQATAADTAELLRQVAAGVRAGDRARLGRDLHAVSAATGLALSAVTPPVLHRLAGDLLGHEPGPQDVARLRTAAAARVSALLPGTAPVVLDTLIERICRAPVQDRAEGAAHPADNAVTSSVLTGVLLARLGRDAGVLDHGAPEPLRRPPEAGQP